MSGPAGPRPIAIVTGMLGSGKTTMIGRLLAHPAMADTLVLVNEFGQVGLDHHLLKAVTDAVVLLPNGCLCCTVKDDVLQTLRDMRRAWLSGAIPDVGRVLIETTGLAEPAPLVAAITGDPLILDAFELAALSTVVDGQHGLGQFAERPTCRNQIRLADHLMLSKGDLADAAAMAALRGRLRDLNPLATIADTTDVEPDRLFRRDAIAPHRWLFACDETSDHAADTSAILLRPSGELPWQPFRTWLGGILDRHGGHLLRLKGRLTFADQPARVVIQAVHHHFYPLVEAPAGRGDEGDFLVLIFAGPVPDDVAKTDALWTVAGSEAAASDAAARSSSRSPERPANPRRRDAREDGGRHA